MPHGITAEAQHRGTLHEGNPRQDPAPAFFHHNVGTQKGSVHITESPSTRATVGGLWLL